MSTPAGKRLRLLASALSVLVLLAAVAAGWFYRELRASLPRLDGTAALPGLSANVTVARDALGIPWVRGASRADIARALGYLHAQDRFFQMDLLRRRGAGELAELFGKAALPLDQTTRVHGFRQLAEKVYAGIAPAERALLEITPPASTPASPPSARNPSSTSCSAPRRGRGGRRTASS